MAITLFFFLVFFARFYATESKYLAYNTSQGTVEGKLNVHLVPHTHDDVGWLKTVDQVGSNNSIQGACVQNVLDSIVPALLADKNRKFIYVEQAFFQRWWRDQSDVIKTTVKNLISSGQLELINGGMCMHDEATPHYIDMIDQTTLGHRFIKKEFGLTPRIGWQIDPFGHSAVQAYLLSAEVGYDSLFFGRIDYQDRAKRKDDKSLEFVWQGSKTLGSSANIFAGAFPVAYEPPDTFYFEVDDDSPIVQDDINLFDYNVQDRVNDFVAVAIAQANITRTNHIMWTMGTDFKYQYANTWFRQMDKLIHYVNLDGRVNALYSTPSIYTDAKYATNESWPIKTDDFFPYADHANAYWTGYFTSRPAIKRYVRMMSGYYLAARQLEYFRGRNRSRPTTDTLADALAIAQHHDAVSGTEKQHVADDYAKRLSIGYVEAEELVAYSLASLVESPKNRSANTTTKFKQIQGNFYLRIDPLGEGAKWRRSFGQEIYSPFLLAFTEQDGGSWTGSHQKTFSGMAPTYSLPDNVAMITLEELDDGKVLLRLAHLYEMGEDKDLSVMANVEIKKMFPDKKIAKVSEMNLSANQERAEMEKKRLVWKVEGAHKVEAKLMKGGPVDPAKLVVEMGPMEIRTFVIVFWS